MIGLSGVKCNTLSYSMRGEADLKLVWVVGAVCIVCCRMMQWLHVLYIANLCVRYLRKASQNPMEHSNSTVIKNHKPSKS